MKNTRNQPVNILVLKLRPFAGHPFKVKDDEEMNTLIESVQTQGILSPLIVCEIFELYASGETKAKIVKDLQRRKVKTSIGNEFTYNSLSRLLKNKRYIGIYLYKGVETPGGMPRILADDLFYRVQSLMNKNKSAPARTRGENEYLLTTKLFCGHCKEMMVDYGGTGKSGKQYHYYMCKKKCDKKIIGKQYIEDRVVSECLKMLTDDKIRYIAKRVAEECNKSPDNISVREIKKAIK